MADWVWVESTGTAGEETVRQRVAQFGDGYAQRVPDGINALVQRWPMTFTDVDDAVADDMIAFLRARYGQPFSYVPLWATVAIQVVCTQWRRALGSRVGTSTITATFEQDFAP